MSFDFNALVASLEQESRDLSYLQHPVTRSLNGLNKVRVRKIVKEYSQFSNEAIHMLLDARIRVSDWPLLAEEVDRNIEEEKGSKTKGVPHLEIMRVGYLKGMKFDVNDHDPSEPTKELLYRLRRTFRRKNNAYIAGALLALESVSVAEFYVLEDMLRKLAVQNAHLKRYVEGHKKFELDHQRELAKACAFYITEENAGEFQEGYRAVCTALVRWWRFQVY